MSDEYYAAGYTDSGVKIPLNANSSAMFKGCSGLSSLDLSGFNTGSVTKMNRMFEDCSGLVTIYASESFSTDSVTNGFSMFAGCTSLAGGSGTAYNGSLMDYARIDDPANGLPGYFTAAP